MKEDIFVKIYLDMISHRNGITMLIVGSFSDCMTTRHCEKISKIP